MIPPVDRIGIDQPFTALGGTRRIAALGQKVPTAPVRSTKPPLMIQTEVACQSAGDTQVARGNV